MDMNDKRSSFAPENNGSTSTLENDTTTTDKPESFAEFAENTTMHGGRFLIHKSIKRRVFWFVCILAAASYCQYSLYQHFTYFLQRPYTTAISSKREKTSIFPDISICNINPVHTGKYRNVMKNRFPNASMEDLDADIDYLADVLHDMMGSGKAQPVQEPKDQKYTDQMSRFASLIENLNDSSHSLSEMLLPTELFGCQFQMNSCGIENFTAVRNMRYAQCYTFRPTKSRVAVVGNLYGLRLRLHVQSPWYLKNSKDPIFGLKLHVHRSHEHQTFQRDDVLIQPGVHTSLSLQRTDIYSLPYPYDTKCGTKKLKYFKDLPYTQELCQADCFAAIGLKICGCSMYLLPGLSLCTNQSQVMCSSFLLHDIRSIDSFLECQNSCPTECSTSEFRTVQSTALLNTKHLVDDANKYCKHDNKSTSICQEMRNMSDAQNIQYFRENFVSINVYLKDFYFEEVRQVPVFGWSELVSGVGGNFGLFLGMSILTIMEFFEFQLRRVYYYATLPSKRTQVHHGGYNT